MFRSTVLGELVGESDWDALLKICKYEHFSMISMKKLNLEDKMFLIVLSGELDIYLSDESVKVANQSKQVHLKTVLPGELVHMFPEGSSRVVNGPGGFVTMGKYRATYVPRNTHEHSSIATISIPDIQLFLNTRQHLTMLNTIVYTNISSVASSCFDYKGLTNEQVRRVLSPAVLSLLTICLIVYMRRWNWLELH